MIAVKQISPFYFDDTLCFSKNIPKFNCNYTYTVITTLLQTVTNNSIVSNVPVVKRGHGTIANYAHSFTSATLSSNPICYVGVDEISKQTDALLLYPNPSSGIFYITINHEINDGKIILINSLGQNVFEQKLAKWTNKITIEGLSQGLFHYVIIQNNIPTNSGTMTIE